MLTDSYHIHTDMDTRRIANLRRSQHPLRVMRRVFMLVLLCLVSMVCRAISTYKVHTYDNLTANLLDMRDIAQDHKGFIWISSSAGLYRFDGYTFKQYRFYEEQNETTTSDIDDMECDQKGHLWLRSGNRAYHFDTDTYTFSYTLRDLEESQKRTFVVRNIVCFADGMTWMYCDDGTVLKADSKADTHKFSFVTRIKSHINGILHDGRQVWILTQDGNYVYRNGKVTATSAEYRGTQSAQPFHRDRFGKNWQREDINAPGLSTVQNIFKDNQDNLWYILGRQLFRISFHAVTSHEIENETMPMRWATRDRKGQTWIANRTNKDVTLYGPDNQFIGYLTKEGTFTKELSKFHARVYVIFEDSHGTIWMGTKPHGVFCLRQTAPGKYHIENLNKSNSQLNDNEIIDIAEDNEGRVWLCGFRNGLNCVVNAAEIGNSRQPLTASQMKVMPVRNIIEQKTVADTKFRRVVFVKQNALLAATSVGLAVYDMRTPLASLAKGDGTILHQHADNDTTTLTSSALKTVVQTTDGQIYVCTRDAGINLLTSKNVTDKNLRFRHFDMRHGFPCDYITSAFESNGALWITSLNTVYEWNPAKPLPESAVQRMTYSVCDFSESNPCQRADGSWVIGTQNGCIAVSLDQLKRSNIKPRQSYPIVLTSHPDRDTITLDFDNRSLNLSFATLDYGDAQRINYAVRLIGDEDAEWQYLGQTHDISFQHLDAGSYTLEIRSTDSQGEWLNNTRRIHVYVTPAFYETWIAKVLFLLFLAAIGFVAYRLWHYIKSIEHQQHETLDAYMQLMAEKEKGAAQRHEQYRKRLLEKAKVEVQNDDFIKNVVRYIEQHISDSDIDIDTMAQQLAVSRSQLNHKLKHILGVTPSEMIREARIKHACTLLEDNSKSINDIAYACGFTDPKYFSKCFKASTGYSPSNYRMRM